MAWLNPAFMTYNAAIDDPNVTADPWTAVGAIDASYPTTNLHDLRAQTQCRWTSAATTHTIMLDRVAGFGQAQYDINALILANTNLFSKYMLVEADTTTAFSGSQDTLFGSSLIFPRTDGGWDFYPLTATQKRYIRISFPTTSVAPQIGQLWFTYYAEMTRGPVQNWTQTIDLDRSILPSGASLHNRTRRESIGLEWRKLSSTDAKLVRHVVDGQGGNAASVKHDGNRPVIVRYPYGSAAAEANVRLMNVTRYSESADTEVPADDAYLARIELELTETKQ